MLGSIRCRGYHCRRILPLSVNVRSNIHTYEKVKGQNGCFGDEYYKSIADPESFWGNAASELQWFEFPDKIYDDQSPAAKSSPLGYRWFGEGKINTCFNALDVNCSKGRGDQVAIYYDSPLTGNTKRSITYKELLDEVSKFAGGMVNLGVKKGDRIVIYMPMIPEAIVAMLACSRIGAIHSVVFGGFAAKELATRIDDSKPKLIISASCGVEPSRIISYKPILDEALCMASHTVSNCVIVQRENVQMCEMRPGKDIDYKDFVEKSNPHDAVPLLSSDTHYILYTSGTTGLPKGVCIDTGGYATALKWAMNNFYSTKAEEVFWAASDIGWTVGHGFIVYAPLLQGCSTILYEGKPVNTPDAGAWWRVIQEYKVKTLFAAPTGFRAIKQEDPEGDLIKKYDVSSLEALFLAGERSDPELLRWCESNFKGRPAVDHWWQTELAWPGAGNSIGLGVIPSLPGACAAAVPGHKFSIVDDKGNIQPNGSLGNLVIELPLPPGTLSTLYNNDDRFVSEYLEKFPSYYNSGDEGFIDNDGYIHIMGRTDDAINVAGHRLSTSALEEVLLEHHEVAECAVIGVKDQLKGEIPIGFVTLISDSCITEEKLANELIENVRKSVGPVASFKKVSVVKSLPKTRSGKILRGTMRKIANGEKYTITPTIEDPSIFDVLGPKILSAISG